MTWPHEVDYGNDTAADRRGTERVESELVGGGLRAQESSSAARYLADFATIRDQVVLGVRDARGFGLDQDELEDLSQEISIAA